MARLRAVASACLALVGIWAAALALCSCDGSASRDASAADAYLEASGAVTDALCGCGECDVGPEIGECVAAALGDDVEGLTPQLQCRTMWLKTVADCVDSAQCVALDLATCKQPLGRLGQVCDPWPAEVSAALTRCTPALVGEPCVGSGDGCAPPSQVFTCDDGRQLPRAFRCDLTPNCQDGSDEVACEDVHFTCEDGRTVPESFRCDLEADCLDGSDERDCADAFKCNSGRELRQMWVCDGFEDCPDGEDEANC